MSSLPGYLCCLLSLLTLSLPVASQAQPDLSGVWMPVRGPGQTEGFPRSDWPYTEKGQALYDAYTAEFDPDKDDPAFFCVQPGMPMSMAAAAPFPVEIIQREQDITLFFEAYSQYRKIWMEEYEHPDPILHSRMGYSVGHWQGNILMVETNMLAERTLGRSLMSENASFTEQIRVDTNEDGQRILIDEIVFTDPEIYTEDIRVRGVWVEANDLPIMEYVCTEEIYQQHLDRVRAGN